MKAVVFHGIGDIRLDDVKEPHIKEENDAIVALTAKCNLWDGSPYDSWNSVRNGEGHGSRSRRCRHC
jgi:Alcohol dehydrogenase GroES-associated